MKLKQRFAAPGAVIGRWQSKRIVHEWLFLFFWTYIFWCELVVRFMTAQFFWTEGLIPAFLFAGVGALTGYGLCSVFSQKVNRRLSLVFTYGLFVFYASQLIYHHVFHFFYSAYSMGNGGQILEFWKVTLKAMGVKCIPLLLMLLPAVGLHMFRFAFDRHRLRRRSYRVAVILLSVAAHFGVLGVLPVLGTAPMSPYDLYYNTNDMTRGALQLGLLPAFRLDVHRLMFGFEGGDLQEAERPEEIVATESLQSETELRTEPPTEAMTDATEQPTETMPVPEAWYDPSLNMLELDFGAFMKETENDTVLQLHRYFSEQIPTEKNEKTGMFEGCNLIMITAESLSHHAIDPELTPTLYRLQQEGFYFENFYTPYWSVSTSDGEYTVMTGTIPKSGAWSFDQTSDNAMPLTMVQQLKKLGYTANAYHNHSYTYYHRNNSHPNLGYDFKAVGNGLEVTELWPESDLEMVDVTTSEYMGKEPFHAYYMTVSGHLPYDFSENDIAAKNWEYVEGLDCSEPVKAYLACQIELDRALELLLQRLEEAGVADNTVIVLTADHYPYGLTMNQLNELAGHELDPHFELYQNTCIIYKPGMEPETVREPCSSLDVLPTLSNLFGLEFDSRLYMGRDIFSEAEPLVLFSNRSWITQYGSYYTLTEEATSFEEGELTPEAVEYYNNIVSNKFLVSEWILEEDYWRYLFGDNLPPEHASEPIIE